MKESSTVAKQRTAPTKRLYYQMSPQRRKHHRLERVAYGENFCRRGFTGKERDEETGLYYYGARYMDAKTSRWLSTDPALTDYIPGAPINDEVKKANQNLPGMGGVFNYVNMHLYHYAGNNPIKYLDPDGESVYSALSLIIKYKDTINAVAEKYGVDAAGIGSVIFQEKFHGVFADLKNAGAYVRDALVTGGDLQGSSSYGLAEMQLNLAGELLGIDPTTPEGLDAIYNALQDDATSIDLIGAYIAKNENEMGRELKGSEAGYAHNMGASRYEDYLSGVENPPNDSVPKRSENYQSSIKDALNGILNTTPDNER